MKKSTVWQLYIVLLCVFAFGAGLAVAGPMVEIPNATFDFGKTLQHVKVTHDFWIKSVGDAPLRITKVVPGCGCTEMPLLDSVLAPGDSTLLAIVFSTKSYAGNITKRPYILTNASEEKVQMTIKAEVMIQDEMMAPLKISPFKIDVSQPSPREHRHAVFLIENKGERDLGLTIVDNGGSYFQAELPKGVKVGETVEGIVVVPEESAGAEFEKSLTFQISGPDGTRYTLPVTRLLKPPVEGTE